MEGITYHNKDVTAKVMADTLKGKSLTAFGRPDLKIVDVLPTNLPAIESNELRLDNLFLLSDGSLAIIDYESSFDRENFVKYLNYIARVIKRFAVRKELKNLKRVKIVIIYTADVEQAEEIYDLGGLVLVVESVYLIHLDGNEIYSRLKRKIDVGDFLSDEELMELMVLPLTFRGDEWKRKAIKQAVGLAGRLPDRSDQIKALSGILTFCDKVIDPDYAKKVKEEMQMTQVGQMLIQEGLEQGRQEGIRIFIQDNLLEKIPQERILEKLKKNYSLSDEEAREYFRQYSILESCERK